MAQGRFVRLGARLMSRGSFSRAALLVGSLACLLPAAASAQWDTMLRTFMQNVAPPSNQPPPSYSPPPAYYGQPRPAYGAPPTGAYQQYPQPPAYYGQPRPVMPTAADRQRAAEMQRMLDDLGYDAGPPTGSWGERAGQALRAFLRDHGQPGSGEVTPIAQAAVRSAWHERGPGVTPSAPVVASGAPSFDCRRAAAPAEIAICRDPSLAELDQDLNGTYREAQAAAVGDNAVALAAQQRAWMRQRNACGANARCLRQTMTARLTDLHGTRQDSGIAAGPDASEAAAAIGAAQPEQGPAPGQNLAPELNVADKGDPLARLVHPPSGLRPWPLDMLNGRFFVDDAPSSPFETKGPGLSTGAAFVQLLAMGTLPGYLDKLVQNNVSAYVSGLFTDDVGKSVFGEGGPSQNGWTGSNEFESERSRQKFDGVYAPMLRDLAPKPPFELRWVERVMIGSYDAARGGFPVTTFGATGLGSRQRLALVGITEGAGFVMAPGFTMPDLFWSVSGPAAETGLHRLPQRVAQLAAVIEVVSVEPSTKDIALQLRKLSLYTPDRSTRLYDFPIAPGDGGTAAQAPAQASTFAAAAPAAAVPGSDAASANGADAARRWRLPTLKGLPLIAPDLTMIQLQFYGADSPGRLDGMTLRAPTEGNMPSSALWTRAIQSLALASTPDAPGKLTDHDEATLACLYLLPATRTQMFGQDCCRFQPFVTGAEFALKDGAAAFRTRELPAIIAAAPRLPLRMLVLLKVHSDRYDGARSGFPLRYMQSVGSGPPRLFGSTLDMLLPDFWPASEAEARAFLASQAGRFGSDAWLALTVSVVGTIPGHASGPLGAGGAGLPGGASWRFQTDDATLYADAGLQRALHRFGTAPQRLPQPIMATPEEQAPRPLGPMPLNGEAALLALHNKSVAADLQLDWLVAAAERARFEDTFRDRSDWQDFDPWGVFFPRGADLTDLSKPDAKANAERYRAWSARRSAAMPRTFSFWRQLQGQRADGSPQTIAVLGDDWRHVGPFDNNPSSNTPSPDLARQLQSRGIETSQMLPIQMLFPGNQLISVYAAVPQPRQSYTVTVGDTGAVAPQQGEAPPRLVVQSELAGVEVLPNGGNGNAFAVVLRLVPKTVELRKGAATVSTTALPGVGWADAEAAKLAATQAAAAQSAAEAKARDDAAHAAAQSVEASVRSVAANALAGVPYGPDVVGLRLGMGMAEAEDIIRRHMTVGMVLEGTPGGGGTGTRDLGPVRIFVNGDKTEQIVLLDRSSGKVLGIRRTVAVPEALSDEQLLDTLRAKYGPPLSSNAQGRKWQWGKSEIFPCVVFGTMTTQLKLLEGPPSTPTFPAMLQREVMDHGIGFVTPWDYSVAPAPSLAQTANCEARLEVWRNATRMFESVYDVRIFAVQAVDAAAKAASQAAPPAL